MYEDLSTKPGCPVCRNQGFFSISPCVVTEHMKAEESKESRKQGFSYSLHQCKGSISSLNLPTGFAASFKDFTASNMFLSLDGGFEIRERFGSCFLVSLQLVPFPFYLFKLHSTTTSILHFHAEDGEPCFRASCYSSAGCFSWVSWHKSFGAVIKVLYLASHTFQKVNKSHCSCCEVAVWM